MLLPVRETTCLNLHIFIQKFVNFCYENLFYKYIQASFLLFMNPTFKRKLYILLYKLVDLQAFFTIFQ